MPPSDYISTYRLSGFSPRLHLSVYQPAVAASGTLSSTPSNNTVSIAVSFVVGSEANVKAGFQIVFTDTATGAYKGESRIRHSGSITSSSLPIRELAQGTASLASGDTFTVYRFVPLDSKLTSADVAFAPDAIPYTDQGSNPPPIVCSGGHWAGRVDSGQTFASVTTDGTNSSLVDPDSATPVTHLWTLPAGVAFQAGSASTDASPVLEVNAGSYLVQHDETDPDNSKTATQYVAYRVHDASDTPYDVLLSALDGDTENGVTFTVEVLGQAGVASDAFALTDIPYGALALLWSNDWFTDGVTRDLHRSAVTGRSHILGMGYISYETNAGDAETGDTISFEIRSPLTRLSEIAAYSKVMLAEASPNEWNEMKTLGVKRGLTQLVQFYTTLTEAGYDYVYHADFSDALYPAHFLQRSDPIAQLRELVDARNAWLVQRERGARFEVQALPYCRALNDRADLDITLTDTDVYDYDYSVPHFDRIESFELRGITAGASGNTDVYSRSPGSSPGYGKDADTIERVIPDSQADANITCGMRYAFAEQIYIDADGLKQRVGELTLRCPGLYNVLDFTGRFVKLNYAHPRWDFNDLRFWLKSYAFEVDAESGEPLTTFVWRAETAAPAGTTYTPPVENVTVAPISPLPPVTVTPQRVIPWSGVLPTRAVILSAAGARLDLITSINPTTFALTYEERNTGLTGNGRWGYSNPYNYKQFYAGMDTGLYSLADVEVGGTNSLLMNNASLFDNSARALHFVGGSITRNGFGVALSGVNGLAYSFDGWSTRTLGSIGGVAVDWTAPTPGGHTPFSSLCMVERTPGHAYAIYAVNGNLYRTTDYCQTWNQDGGANPFASASAFKLGIPFTRENGAANADDGSLELHAYYVGDVHSGATDQVHIFTTDGTSGVTSVREKALNGGQAEWGAHIIRPLTSFTHDARYGFVADAGNLYVAHTEDAYATLVNGSIAGGSEVNGFSTNPDVAFAWRREPSGGGGNRAWFSFDGGATWHVIVPDTAGWVADDGVAYLEGSLYTEQ